MNSEERQRLRAIPDNTGSYGAAVLDQYQYEPKGQFYRDLRALLDALDAAEGERDDYRERLRDVVMIDAEEWALSGGGPGINARREQAWTRAREPFEP